MHHQLTGLTNKNTLEVAAYRESTGKPMWLRYVLVPGWTDQPEYLEEWGQYFANYKTVERIEIIPFHPLGSQKWELLKMNYLLKDTPAPTAESKAEAFTVFSKYFKNVILK